MPLQKHERWLGISERRLAHEARSSGWIVFRSVYWAVYAMSLSVLLLYYTTHNVTVELQIFLGISLVLLAIMLVLYGFAEVAHRRLMRKYG